MGAIIFDCPTATAAEINFTQWQSFRFIYGPAIRKVGAFAFLLEKKILYYHHVVSTRCDDSRAPAQVFSRYHCALLAYQNDEQNLSFI
ncbi:MAG: hypothetical protein IPL99_29860 [Candidatus Competibacteraceae bacterium]|nr:hypothetical protein [Candidatus Competibacteraceae bacterium]